MSVSINIGVILLEDFDKCEKCGGEIEYRRVDRVHCCFCKNCDWNLVTTYLPELDENTYSILS